MTDYTNNALLDLVFGSKVYTPPAMLYLGLSTNAANRSGSVIEPSGGGYGRLAVENHSSTFLTASEAMTSNAIELVFPAPTTSWGTIVSLFIADSPRGGNVLAMADLLVPRMINRGCPASLAAGALCISYT